MDMKESIATDVATTIPDVIAGKKSALMFLIKQPMGGYAVLRKTDCKVENYKTNQISSYLLQYMEFLTYIMQLYDAFIIYQ